MYALFLCVTIGISYAMPTNGGSGGCTTTAAAARKFYSSAELRDRVVALCPPEKVFVFEEILVHSKFENGNINILLSCSFLQPTLSSGSATVTYLS